MSSYASSFGEALAKAEARKSPLLAALYQTSTGNSPYEPSASHGGQQQSAQQHGRYKSGGGGPDPDLLNRSHMPLDMDPTKQPVPLNPDAGSANIGILPVPSSVTVNQQAPPTQTSQPIGGYFPGGEGGDVNGGYGPGFYGGYTGINSGSTWGQPQGPTGTSTSTFTPEPPGPGGYSVGTDLPPGGGGDEGPGGKDYNPYDDGEDMAHGGYVGRGQVSRVAESGPEMAGGRIISKPSIVKLEKGESVIPLTPREGNKLQLDLLEGHVAAMKSPRMQFSRYKSFGQGRGLMR